MAPHTSRKQRAFLTFSMLSDEVLPRAVADGPVGPAMAGPIIDPVILIFLIFFFPTGPIIEPVILIFAIYVNTDSP